MKQLILLIIAMLSLNLTGCGSGGMSSSTNSSSNPGGTGTTPQNCTFNGATVLNGNSVSAFQAASVPNGQSCVSQQRTCNNGTLSGSYAFASCVVESPTTQSCVLDGVTVVHNQSRNFFNSATVACGQTCQSLSRTCNNGTLSGSATYNRASCSVVSCNPCALPWGGTLAHNATATAYQAASVPNGQTCTSQTRTCNNGTLSGSYTNQSCTVLPPAPTTCNLPWGGTINGGQSATAYQAATVPNGQTCSSQSRSCSCTTTACTLSGTYQFQSCTVQPPPPTSGGLEIDLSFVNLQSTQYQSFRSHVDNGLTSIVGADDEGYATDAAYMFRLTNDRRYCDRAIQRVDAQVTADEANIAAGTTVYVARDSYLYVGPIIMNLAITYDWCSAYMNTAQRTRWAAYADQAISNVWNYSTATWGGRARPWSGWSVENPGNNYHFSFIEATMSWALASGNQNFMNLLTSNTNIFGRTARLPNIVNYYSALPGGGSQEGTGYGTAQMHLFSNYELWKDSTGQDHANANSHLTDTIRWWVHATVPTLDRFAPIGDQARDSGANVYDYHRRLVLEARHLTNDNAAKSLASWWLNNISIGSMTSRMNRRFDLYPAGTAPTTPTENLAYYATGTGQLFARTDWTTAAMWFGLSAGPYRESHAHQDQGAFSLFANNWLASTQNMRSHSGINQETIYHNIVRFETTGGSVIPQREGTTSTLTLNSGTNLATGVIDATANLTPAYAGNATVSSWTRNVTFANRLLTVRDNYSTSGIPTFQVNVPVVPTVTASGTDRIITAGQLRMRVISPANATVTIVNWNSVDASEHTGGGYRIDVRGATGTGQFQVQFNQQ